jgi:hypothetical protein
MNDNCFSGKNIAKSNKNTSNSLVLSSIRTQNLVPPAGLLVLLLVVAIIMVVIF